MPYGEKLKTIKKEKNLTNAEIHRVCNVPLATVTRVFDEGSQGGNFETYVSLARGLGFSLDELAGLKQPDDQPLASPIIETFNSYSEILKEKDTFKFWHYYWDFGRPPLDGQFLYAPFCTQSCP